jgi:hypothetical protein
MIFTPRLVSHEHKLLPHIFAPETGHAQHRYEHLILEKYKSGEMGEHVKTLKEQNNNQTYQGDNCAFPLLAAATKKRNTILEQH